MTTLTLTGPHPYYPSLGIVTLTVPLLDGPPGHAIRNLGKVAVTTIRRPDAWTPLTTEFCIVGYAAVVERAALLGLLWDLAGQPMHPSRGRRQPGTHAVVLCDGRKVEVWRPTCELRFSADEKAIREREKNEALPDGRRKEAA
jgi:hypothetical protein